MSRRDLNPDNDDDVGKFNTTLYLTLQTNTSYDTTTIVINTLSPFPDTLMKTAESSPLQALVFYESTSLLF